MSPDDRGCGLIRTGRIGEPRFFTSECSYQVRPGNIRADAAAGGGAIWGPRALLQRYDQFAPELVEFSRCILEHRQPEPDGWEGLADVRIIAAALRSAREHAAVRVEPVQRRSRPAASQAQRRPPGKPPPPVHAESPHE